MGIILVFDCTDLTSFENIPIWIKQIEKLASEEVAIILVANKTDLPNRCVSKEQGEKLASKKNLPYYETSASNGANINELFLSIAIEVIQKKQKIAEVI